MGGIAVRKARSAFASVGTSLGRLRSPNKDHTANAAFSSLANASDMVAQGLSPIVDASAAGNGRDLRKVRGLRTAHSQPPR